MLTNVYSDESNACAICFDVARSPWKEGNFNPKHQRQNKANDFDLPHAKNSSNFPLQCHRAGNIGLKTPSFLLLSTHVWPKVWMRSVGDASAYCTIEIESEREREKEANNFDISSSVPWCGNSAWWNNVFMMVEEFKRAQFVDGQPVGASIRLYLFT